MKRYHHHHHKVFACDLFLFFFIIFLDKQIKIGANHNNVWSHKILYCTIPPNRVANPTPPRSRKKVYFYQESQLYLDTTKRQQSNDSVMAPRQDNKICSIDVCVERGRHCCHWLPTTPGTMF